LIGTGEGGQEAWIPKTKEDVPTFWATESKDKVIIESNPEPVISNKG
jgi:hypothetical protein